MKATTNQLKSQVDVEKLNYLRDNLPRGAQKAIAEELGLSQEWVCRVLNGSEFSIKVLLCAAKRVRKHQKAIQSVSEISCQI